MVKAKSKSKPKIKYYLFENQVLMDESDSLSKLTNQMIGDSDGCPFRVIKGYELFVFPEEEPVEVQYYAEDI